MWQNSVEQNSAGVKRVLHMLAAIKRTTPHQTFVWGEPLPLIGKHKFCLYTHCYAAVLLLQAVQIAADH